MPARAPPVRRPPPPRLPPAAALIPVSALVPAPVPAPVPVSAPCCKSPCKRGSGGKRSGKGERQRQPSACKTAAGARPGEAKPRRAEACTFCTKRAGCNSPAKQTAVPKASALTAPAPPCAPLVRTPRTFLRTPARSPCVHRRNHRQSSVKIAGAVGGGGIRRLLGPGEDHRLGEAAQELHPPKRPPPSYRCLGRPRPPATSGLSKSAAVRAARRRTNATSIAKLLRQAKSSASVRATNAAADSGRRAKSWPPERAAALLPSGAETEAMVPPVASNTILCAVIPPF